jgi:uncharacterized protein (TIGR02271 family)
VRSFAAILPGTRVKCEQGFIGTVERLERRWAEPGDQPDRMLVRSDDGRWRYSIPLMFVNRVSQGTFHPVVYLTMQPEELTNYVVEAIPEQERAHTPAPPRTDERAPVEAHATVPASDQQAESGAPDEDLVLSMPIVHEELVVRKEPTVLGTIRVHKGVETEEQHISLPVYHEEAIIEHIAPDNYDRKAYTNPNEVIIPIVEERLVVQKQIVVKEYLRVKKVLVSQTDEVNETLRRETVTVTELRQQGIDSRIGPLLRGAATDGAASRDGATLARPAGSMTLEPPDIADQPTMTDMRPDAMPPA